MVSSALDITLRELLDTLARLRAEYGHDPEYRAWRKGFPKGWPM